MKFSQQKLPNLLNNDFCLLFSCNVIGKFWKKALKSDWLFCFSVPFSLAEKKDAI